MVINQGTLSSWSNTSGVSIGSLENHEQKSVGKLVQTLSMLRIMQSDFCFLKGHIGSMEYWLKAHGPRARVHPISKQLQ